MGRVGWALKFHHLQQGYIPRPHKYVEEWPFIGFGPLFYLLLKV